MWDRLFEVYFGQAYDIFTPASLAALAPSVGLDEAAALEALSSRRYQGQVLADGREASQLGASGVPFVVIDRRYGIAGAQATEVFAQALMQAWDARDA